MFFGGEKVADIPEVVSATITVNNSEVTIKGPKEFVQAEIERLALLLTSTSGRKAQSEEATADLNADEESMSERQLLDVKEPQGHAEIVAVLAFALHHRHGLQEFTEEDMKRAYIRAKVRPPKFVGQALRDAKNKSDFIEYGSGRGTYKLSHHGDRTVRFDLPHK